MTPKSEKDAKSTNKKKTVTKAIQSKPSSKSTKKIEEDDFDFNEEDMETLKSSKKSAFPKSTKKRIDDDNEEEEDEVEDDWTKVDEVDSSWDPDFEEFDIPKSKNKNKAGGFPKKRKRREEDDDDDDFSMDDDFKDLNNDSLDEEDDLY